MAKSSSGKKGGRKIGRNKDFCNSYKNSGQREKNKALRLVKHLEKFPNDRCGFHCFHNLPQTAQTHAERIRKAQKPQVET